MKDKLILVFLVLLLTGCTAPSYPNETIYKVSFCDNFVGEKIEVYYPQKAEPIVREDVNGYEFVGWYEDSEFTRLYDFSTNLTKDIMLFAKYEKVEYKKGKLADIEKVEELTYLSIEVIVSYVGNNYIICQDDIGYLVELDSSLCEEIINCSIVELNVDAEEGRITKVTNVDLISNNIAITLPILTKEKNNFEAYMYQLVNYKGVVTEVDNENSILILDEQIKIKVNCDMPEVTIGEECYIDNLVLVNKENYELLYHECSSYQDETKTPSASFEVVSDYETLEDILDDFEYPINKGLPSIGSPSVLVIPVEFTDYLAPSDMKENLEIAFFDKTGKTGWESLSSYYYKSSYGALDIKGTVLEPFNTGKSSKYYESKYIKGNQDVDYEIIQAALKYYDDVIDYSDYDYNNDGYIDSIYIIYTTPVAYGNSYNECDLWWAYTYEYFTEDYEYYDSVEADYYTFMGYDFLFDALCYGSKEYYVNLNAATIIHETGHLLGLDDYYDYDDSIGPDGGLGGADMMDSNVGDHNAYSKIILGWIKPKVLTGVGVIDLTSFTETGDVIIIKKENNNNFFSEYLILEFYSQTGLNEVFSDGYNLFSTNGLKIYHVDATLKSNPDSIADITKMNNTDTRYKLISLLEADGNNNIPNGNGYFENTDLYRENDSLIDYSWHDKTVLEFDIYITYISNEKIQIEIK